MAGGRQDFDPEGISRVLVVLALCFAAIGIALAAYAVVQLIGGDRTDGVATLALGAMSAVFAVILHRSSLDDGRGAWCPVCIARNPVGAEVCEHCGARIAGHW